MLLAIWIIYVLFCVNYQGYKILINWKLLPVNRINHCTEMFCCKSKKKTKIKEKSKE